MNPIQQFISLQVQEKKRNKVLDEFLEILNPPRLEKNLKPITYGRLQFMLQHLDEWDKAIFLGNCKDAQSPSKFFWWSLKVK